MQKGTSRGTLPMYIPVWMKNETSLWNHLARRVDVFSRRARRYTGSSLHKSRRSMSLPNVSDNSISNVRFVLLCALWYTTSALSSNTGKAILMRFRYPITLTFVQFGFVAAYCLIFMSPLISFSKLRMPTRWIMWTTLPMGVFQVVGHMFSSIAISRIPVSTVHTIKALSPLFTVAAYAILFGVKYSAKTYVSLLPLTVGVMLASSFDASASNSVGLLCAFGSALVFVSSNIFFKKIMPSSSPGTSHQTSQKLDKLNLLLYSAGMAFILMIPLWMYYDLPILFSSLSPYTVHPTHSSSSLRTVAYYFFLNGTVHFAQNIIAFVVLSLTSPVTYSIASLIKRVVVICIAIVWFHQVVHPIQALGIGLTFTGLYMYNQSKDDVAKGEQKMRRMEAAKELMLPTTKGDIQLMSDAVTPPREFTREKVEASVVTAYDRPNASLHGHTLQRSGVVAPTPTPYAKTAQLFPTIPAIKITSGYSRPSLYPSPPPSTDSPPTMVLQFPPDDMAQGALTDICKANQSDFLSYAERSVVA